MKQLLLILVFSLGIFSARSQDTTYTKKVDSLTQLAYQYLYTVKDSAFYYFDEISKLARQEEDWKSLLETGISVNRIAGYHYDLEKMRVNIAAMDTLFTQKSSYFEALPDYHFYQNSLLYDKGAYYFEVDNLKRSRDFFEQLISNTENPSDTLFLAEQNDLLSTAYSFMAKMYANESKYDLAKQYYNRNIRLISEVKPDDLSSLHINYSLLAEVFSNEGAYARSNDYFTRALNYYLQNNGNTNTKVSIAQNIIKNHLNLSQPDSAQHYLSLMRQQLPENHPFWNRYYAIEGDFYAKKADRTTAEQSLKQSLELYQLKWQDKKHEEVALAHNKFGLLFLEADEPEEA
ncbi:MAG: tetratricopeptide repeat protein, partial [Flavobacteriaceae bacterium]